MKSKDIKEIIKTAVSLFLICAVAAGLLAGVNSLTDPKIAENNLQKANESRATVIPEADSFEEAVLSDGTTCYLALKDNQTIGYVFTTSANGYGDAIDIMTGVDTDGVITGISILSINETPGLGMKAKNESFWGQFTGKSGELTVTKNSSAAENEITAITSATITSKAVTAAVNLALTQYAEIAGKEE